MTQRPRSDAEPTLGDLNDLEPAPRRGGGGRQGRVRPARDPSKRNVLLLALLIGVVLVGWLAGDRLRALLPDTNQNLGLIEADQALAQGNLSGEPTAALESYQALLLTDPDNERALAGVKAVGAELIERARTALVEGQIDAAKADFASAERVLLGGAALDQLAADIAQAERAQTELDPLLKQALAAEQAGRLIGSATSAAALYQRALASDSGNAIAQRGLTNIVRILSERTRTALAEGNLARAENLLANAARIDPDAAGLPELRTRLAAARAAAPPPAAPVVPAPSEPAPSEPASSESGAPPVAVESPAPPAAAANARLIADRLAQADVLLRAGRLDRPDDPNARALLEEVLALEPDQREARQMLARIGASYLLKAQMALESGDLDAAQARFEDAERLGASADDLNVVAQAMREADERGAVVAPPDARDQSRAAELVARAEAALARDDLTEPPGESAFDLFRAALRVDPDDQRARSGLGAVADRAETLFGATLADGRLSEAAVHADTFGVSGGDATTRAAMQRELARRWLARSEGQLARGDLRGADDSLAQARIADPDEPALPEIEARLNRAREGALR